MTPTRTARRIIESGDVLTGTNAKLRAILEAYVALCEARQDAFEQAARIADRWCKRNSWPNGAWGIAAEIRALAHKQPLQEEG